MDRDALLQAMMGDYRPEVKPGPNAEMQQEMMRQQPGDRETIARLAQEFAQLQDLKTFNNLLTAVGVGVGGAGAATGNPLIAGLGAGAAGIGIAAGRGTDRRESKLYGEQSAAYPGIYGSQ